MAEIKHSTFKTMIPVLIALVACCYTLKFSLAGFQNGRILYQREIKKKDGTVLPAKYVEGRAAKVWAVVLLILGLGMLAFAILKATGKV
jgi:hypothetical protein